MSDNQPYSEMYRVTAKEWVDAEASASILEESKSATLARLVSDQGDIPVNRAENNVKASEEWQDYITKMVQARRDASFLKVKLEYIRMKFTEQQSFEASRRAEMRL